MRIRAHFDGKVIVPDEPVNLPPGVTVEITILSGIEPRRGSPAAVLRAPRKPPHLSKEDTAELERAIGKERPK